MKRAFLHWTDRYTSYARRWQAVSRDEERDKTVTKRWTQRPPGSTWGDWGDDDELGRINLLTPEKVLQGVREVEAGISFCLSLPLDYPGGTTLNQRRHPPRLAPTEDMDGNADTFYNVHMSEMDDVRRREVRRRLG